MASGEKMKLPCLFQPGILKEAFTALFKGSYTTKFPFVPHQPPEKFRGKPVPDKDWCVGCGACAEVCPSSAIEIIDHPETAKRKVVWKYDRCIFCGQCEANCITEKGVHLTSEFDLAVFDRKNLIEGIEMELVMCEECGTVVGTKKHLLWLVKKLGPLAYGNFPLILTAGGIKPSIQVKPFGTRSNLFSLLCPKCRRDAFLFDEYGKEVENTKV